MGVRAPVPPPPPRRRSGGGAAPLVAGICAVLAAGLAIGGLFVPIHTVINTFEEGQPAFGYDNTWWGLQDGSEFESVRESTTLSGLTIVAAALLLLIGAVFAFAAGRSLRPGVRTAARSLVSAGTALLLGVVALQLTLSLDDLAAWNENELGPGERIDFMVKLGLWLPAAGVLVGIAAVVMAHQGQRVPRREPATPPMGFHRPPYGPGPAAGRPPLQAGQSSGRFAPVPAPAPGRSEAPASRVDESTSDGPAEHDPDSDITQRTSVPGAVPASAAADASWSAAATPPGPPAPVTPPAAVAAPEPADQDQRPAPPATDDAPPSSVAAALAPADEPTQDPAEPTGTPAAPTGAPADPPVPAADGSADGAPSTPVPADRPAAPSTPEPPAAADGLPPVDLPPAPPAPESRPDSDRKQTD